MQLKAFKASNLKINVVLLVNNYITILEKMMFEDIFLCASHFKYNKAISAIF